MSHADARLTVHGRRLIVERVGAGHQPADVAAQLGCSRATVSTWLRRHREEGLPGRSDRPSRPYRTPPEIEARIPECRRAHRHGADRIAGELGVYASTVGRVLARHRVPQLSRLDTLTGAPVRRGPMSALRSERGCPGELVRIDVKELGRIPDGGGRRAHGRPPGPYPPPAASAASSG